MPTVAAGKLSLSYIEKGTGTDTVLIHGIPTDLRAWSAQIPVLADKYRVIAYSRRLAKPNNNPGTFVESTIENNAADLEVLIKAITSSPINLIGHSYGGFIAAYLAANHPELVSKLVLIEPGISTILIQEPESKSQMLSLLLHSPSTALAARRYLRNYYEPMLIAYHANDIETALNLFLDGLMNQAGALGKLAEGIQTMIKENASTIGEVEAKLPRFTEDDASRIKAPTLLINGANGTKVFQSINKKLGEAIPQNRITMIPRSSHFPHLENPDGFNEKVLDFLGQNNKDF